ncbi:hypothetical protein HK096_003182 [Nowakowskiella sp. JEL0078]|nr:hypothetical protein HK096_003182 [Nowakowskiella sp. JEL0078]
MVVKEDGEPRRIVGRRNLNTEDSVDRSYVEFTRLGFVTLNDNQNTGYKARELKSVHVDAEGTYLRILVHKCHLNAINLYNQVGIVAINILGEIRDSSYFIRQFGETSDPLGRIQFGLDPLQLDPEYPLPPVIPSHDNTHASYFGLLDKVALEKQSRDSIEELSFNVYHDKEISILIAAVLKSKEDAIEKEKYILAKALKLFYEQCKKAGAEIARLDVAKHRAIEIEDFDSAEAIKHDMELLRAALHAKLSDLGLQLLQNGMIVSIDEVSNFRNITHIPELSDYTIDRPASSLSPEPLREPTPPSTPSLPQITTPIPLPPVQIVQKIIEPEKQPSPTHADVAISTSSFQLNVPKPDNLPSGLDDPDPLTPAQIEEYELAINMYGMFIIQCLLCRQFKLREWAMAEVAKRVEGWDEACERLERRYANSIKRNVPLKKGGVRDKRSKSIDKQAVHEYDSDNVLDFPPNAFPNPDPKHSVGPWSEQQLKDEEKIRTGWIGEIEAKHVDRETFVKGTLLIIKVGLNDARERSAVLAIALWDQVIRVSMLRKIPSAVVFRGIDSVLQILLTRVCDMNPRIKQASSDLTITLSNAYNKLPFSIFPYILRPVVSIHASQSRKNSNEKVSSIFESEVKKSRNNAIAKTAALAAGAHNRLVKGRLELLKRILLEFRLDEVNEIDENFEAKNVNQSEKHNLGRSGLNVKSVMGFVEPHLSHPNADVRDFAINVVVEVILALFSIQSLAEQSHAVEIPTLVNGFLGGAKAQVVQHIIDRVNEKRGVKVKRLKHRPGNF